VRALAVLSVFIVPHPTAVANMMGSNVPIHIDIEASMELGAMPVLRVISPPPVVTTTTAPPAPEANTVPVQAASVSPSGVWGCIAQHESGGNPATNTGNGYYGAFQDTIGSWEAAGGGPGLPSDYSYATQLAVNEVIQQQQGWGAWPVTSRACGV
jgi:hypothetical protein